MVEPLNKNLVSGKNLNKLEKNLKSLSEFLNTTHLTSEHLDAATDA